MNDKTKIDIQPMPVDKMISFKETALQSREKRVVVLLDIYTQQVENLQQELETTMQRKAFLEREAKNVALAIQLKHGDVVRVVCPKCKGSGLKPTDVMSARDIAHKGSAFESIVNKKAQPEEDPRTQCQHCKGVKWLLMERYKG